MKSIIKRASLGLLVAFVVMSIIHIANRLVLVHPIPEFMIGWLSCVGYSAVYYNLDKH